MHDGRIALAGLVALHAAAFEHEERAALVLQDIALLGEDGCPLLRLALIVDEDAEQLPVRLAARGYGG